MIYTVNLGFRPEQLVQVTLGPKNAGYKDGQVLPFFQGGEGAAGKDAGRALSRLCQYASHVR